MNSNFWIFNGFLLVFIQFVIRSDMTDEGDEILVQNCIQVQCRSHGGTEWCPSQKVD